MIIVLIILSAAFVAIGFLVTEKNAKYLLSGYNTMSEEARKKVDIKNYIPYFRNFHIFLGATLFLGGAIFTYFISEMAGGIFMAVYPIIAYIYFIITAAKYSKGLSKKRNKTGIYILLGTLIFVVGVIGYGSKENTLKFDAGKIEINGNYGEALAPADIQSIELIQDLPQIAFKTNGFALGPLKKGYFKTKKGETIKLIINSENKPVILFTKTDGNKIYYSAKNKSSEEIIDEMKKSLPEVMYK